MAGDQTEAACAAAEALLRALQPGDARTFGVCHTCAYFQSAGTGGVCGLTGEPLSTSDSLKICREHARL